MKIIIIVMVIVILVVVVAVRTAYRMHQYVFYIVSTVQFSKFRDSCHIPRQSAQPFQIVYHLCFI